MIHYWSSDNRMSIIQMAYEIQPQRHRVHREFTKMDNTDFIIASQEVLVLNHLCAYFVRSVPLWWPLVDHQAGKRSLIRIH